MNHGNTIADFFGIDVFSENLLKARTSSKTYQQWKHCVQSFTPISLQIADEIADAMKNWAIDKGATHYTHWFQPMNGITAEKHQAFLETDCNGNAILSFSGKALIQGESDASSFPNGGLRSTFEARGITHWDPSANVFILDKTLYIPSCFYAYSGASLDMKTPLIRSVKAVSEAALRILRLFNNKTTNAVTVCVGAEQEYFLLPKQLVDQREDLRLTGRTLFGNAPPKGQEAENHYYGNIPDQVSEFMKDLDDQLWRIGIMAKTKHNEAAPCQYELAPMFTDACHASDSDQLIMLIMKKIAEKHQLECLLHEKPFHGVNGSGKHINWSLSTQTGKNLFVAGNTPMENAQFLVFLTAFISAVHQYQDLLRVTVAYEGNDHRLGSGEAPPAIISIFLGEELTSFLSEMIRNNSYFRIGKDNIPVRNTEMTDRNRTSPLAFTGNKFEFRMAGSSQSIAEPTTILNTIMADKLCLISDAIKNSDDIIITLNDLLPKLLSQHQSIIFNGNGYATQWIADANNRGLVNNASTAESLDAYLNKNNIALVTKHHVYTHEEFNARYEIHRQFYCKKIQIEAKTLLNIVNRQIIPAVLEYISFLYHSALKKENHTIESEWITTLSNTCEQLFEKSKILSASLECIPDSPCQSSHYCKNEIIHTMELMKLDINLLEQLTSKKYWPFISYSDMLFS